MIRAGADPTNRGENLRAVERCAECRGPILTPRDDDVCGDYCADLDYTRTRVVADRADLGPLSRRERRILALGSLERHLHDIELGDDGPKVSGVDFVIRLLGSGGAS